MISVIAYFWFIKSDKRLREAKFWVLKQNMFVMNDLISLAIQKDVLKPLLTHLGVLEHPLLSYWICSLTGTCHAKLESLVRIVHSGPYF